MLGALLDRVKKHDGPVNLAIDCTGSTSRQGIKLAYSAIAQAILSAIVDRTGVVIFYGNKVEHVIHINQLLEFGIYNLLKTIPSGGHKLQPVYEFMSVASPNDLLIVLTDGFLEIPAQPHFPIAWALAGTNYTEPYYYTKTGVRQMYGECYHLGGDHQYAEPNYRELTTV